MPRVELPAAAARTSASVQTGWRLDRPVVFDFHTPMDRASVTRELEIAPSIAVDLAWGRGDRGLTVTPRDGWKPGVFYVVTIGKAASDLAGQGLGQASSAIFYTQNRPSVTLTLRRSTGGRLLPGGGVEIRFSRPVSVADVRAAFRVTPKTAGALVAKGGSGGFADRFVWTPKSSLRPGAAYTFALAAGVNDRDGVTLGGAATVGAKALGRPKVAGNDPRGGSTGLQTETSIVIRFDRSMDRRSTARALQIIGVGAVTGSIVWSRNDTVLTFKPQAGLRHDRSYTVIVTGRARSRTGVPLAADPARTAFSFRFRTEAAPALAALPPGDGGGSGSGGGTGGGGGTVAGPWTSVESYVLKLMNCVRTGGLIRSDGSCAGYGSGHYNAYLAPLTLHGGISASVARPYAKFLATNAACSHFLDGNPGKRLARAGYSSFRWAENIGCRSGDPYVAVTGSHLYFQSEKPYGGGHWVNLRNPAYTTVGIGVWVANGNVRVVTDFYDP